MYAFFGVMTLAMLWMLTFFVLDYFNAFSFLALLIAVPCNHVKLSSLILQKQNKQFNQ
jgi:hypothetical protein